MNRTLKSILVLTLVQLLLWAGFTGLDWLEEYRGLTSDVYVVYYFVVPVLAAVLYLRFRRALHTERWKSWQNTLLCLAIWIAETAAIGLWIGSLVNYNRWIVPQDVGGWGNFLNGIEYMLLPFFIAGIPLILVPLWCLGTWLYRKYRQ